MKELEKLAREYYQNRPEGFGEPTEDFMAGFRKAREMAEVEANKNANLLDKIKYELDGSVYELTDNEFETVFHVRDNLLEDFNRLGEREVEE